MGALMSEPFDTGTPFGVVMSALSQRGQIKRAGSGFLACCPVHGDRDPSLSVKRGDDGRALLNCKVGCSFKDIMQALGMRESDAFPEDSSNVTELRPKGQQATLAEFAAHKKLPIEFVKSLGWSDAAGGIAQPYRTRAGAHHCTRIRRGLGIKDGMWWAPSGVELAAYEPDGGALAKQERYTILVEGESDTATLLYTGFPALGCPGADTVERVLQAHHVDGLERVFYVVEPDRGGEQFAKLAVKRLDALGFTGGVHELRMPDAAKDPSALFQRDPDAFPAKLCAALDAAKRRQSGPVVWRSTVEIFEPLPPVKWRVRGLQICPGRPAMLAGYGASAKTLSAQALAIAVASGTPAWGFFETTAGQVRHLDFEQGWHATARRYQRLAYGHRVDPRELSDRLKLAIFPQAFLDAPNATDVYAKLCDGVDLVVLDALRGATPTQDENDSRIRPCLDNLSRVSEKTGTAFLVLHHARKQQQGASGDPRELLRGSSAIFDGCGCIFTVTAGKEKGEPRRVQQAKPPAEAEGAPVQDFSLLVDDVPGEGNPARGVRVMYAPIQEPDRVALKSAAYDARKSEILEMVRRSPGLTKNAIVDRVGINRSTGLTILDELEREGRLRAGTGERGAQLMHAVDWRSHNRPREADE